MSDCQGLIIICGNNFDRITKSLHEGKDVRFKSGEGDKFYP